MKKKALSLVLALVMCLSLTLPAMAVQPDEVYQSMIELKSQYPEGMPWTNENYYRWNGGIYSGGYGCAGFAFILSDAAFGDLPARVLAPFSYSDVRAGDILRINNDTHSVIVLQVYSDHVVIAEGNYNRSIHWGRSLSKERVEQADYLMTRYPESTDQPTAKDFTYNPPQSLTYDGSSKTAAVRAAVASSVHNGYFTLTFTDEQDNSVTDLVKPGTYRVLAKVSAHGGYAAGEVSLGSVTITESPGLHGRISISVGDDASQNSSGTTYVVSDVIITIHASPDPGYQLSIIRVIRDDNGQQIPLSGSGNTRTFRMPPADVSIQAEFSVR